VGISFAQSTSGVALVFVSFGMLSLPYRRILSAVRCVLYQTKSVNAESQDRVQQGVDSALTDEEVEQSARAFLVAVT